MNGKLLKLLHTTLDACYKADDGSSMWKEIISIYEKAITDIRNKESFSVKNALRIYLEFNSDYTSEFFLTMDKAFFIEKQQKAWNVLADNEYCQSYIDGILVKINIDNFNNQTLEYANKIVAIFNDNKSKVLDNVVAKIFDFYGERYTLKEIKNRLNKPYVEIINDNFGVLVWLNHDMDEHIIECEFGNDLELYYVTVDG